MCGRIVFFFSFSRSNNFQNSRGLKRIMRAEKGYVFWQWQGHSSSVITKRVTRSRGKQTDCFAGRGGMEINKRGSPHCRRIGNNTHTWTGRALSSHVERDVKKSRENFSRIWELILDQYFVKQKMKISIVISISDILRIYCYNSIIFAVTCFVNLFKICLRWGFLFR